MHEQQQSFKGDDKMSGVDNNVDVISYKRHSGTCNPYHEQRKVPAHGNVGKQARNSYMCKRERKI